MIRTGITTALMSVLGRSESGLVRFDARIQEYYVATVPTLPTLQICRIFAEW